MQTCTTHPHPHHPHPHTPSHAHTHNNKCTHTPSHTHTHNKCTHTHPHPHTLSHTFTRSQVVYIGVQGQDRNNTFTLVVWDLLFDPSDVSIIIAEGVTGDVYDVSQNLTLPDNGRYMIGCGPVAHVS